MAQRGRPKGSRNKTPEEQAKEVRSLYRIYADQDGLLKQVKEARGRNASDALNSAVKAGLKPNDKPFVVVPDRNITTLSVKAENITKTKISRA